MFSEFLGSFTDAFGGKSNEYSNKLDEIYQGLKREITKKAQELKGDAIIGFDIQFNQITGKNQFMMMASATGTVVKIRKDAVMMYKHLYDLDTLFKAGVMPEEIYKSERAAYLKENKNVIQALEHRVEIERQQAEHDRELAERKRVHEEWERQEAERQAHEAEEQKRKAEEALRLAEQRRKEEETRKQKEEEIAKNRIREIMSMIDQNFDYKKDNVECVTFGDLVTSSYREKADVEGMGNDLIVKYLVSIDEYAAACKCYMDEHHTDLAEAIKAIKTL